MANWYAMQKRRRLMMDTPLQEDMTSEGQSHGGPKNLQNVLSGTDPAQQTMSGMRLGPKAHGGKHPTAAEKAAYMKENKNDTNKDRGQKLSVV